MKIAETQWLRPIPKRKPITSMLFILPPGMPESEIKKFLAHPDHKGMNFSKHEELEPAGAWRRFRLT